MSSVVNAVRHVTGGLADLVTGAVDTVGNAVSKAVDSVIHNPVGALVDVGLLYMGVPPIYAGAAAGAANAAANHGNILQGALTGGAMAGAAGFASEFAGAQGLGTVGQAAAGGAAAGATGAALTGQGLSNVVRGALSGGMMGGAIGYIQKPNGTITYTYDDGSTLTRNADGSYSSTASGSIPAPVIDKSTYSIDKVNLSSSWTHPVDAAPGTVWTGPAGAEIVLDGGKVLPLDVYRAAVATGKPIFVDGVTVDPSFADIATKGQGNISNTGNIVEQYRTPGTALASVEEINTGKANYNPQAHAWETSAVTDANSSSVYHPAANIQSTGLSDSAPGTIYNGPNGPEIVLNSGKTVMLHDYDTLINSGNPVTVDGQLQTQFRVEMGGSAGYKENPSMAKPEFRTPGSDLASQAQIDSGEAKWNAAANAWEVGGTTPGEITQPIAPTDVGSHPTIPTVEVTAPVEATPVPAPEPVTGPVVPVVPTPGTTPTGTPATGTEEKTTTNADGSTTTVHADGSTTTVHADGTVTTTPAAGGGGTTPTGPVAPEPLKPLPSETIPPTEKIPTVEAPTEPTPTEPTPTEPTPTEPTPVVPIVPVTPTETPKAPEYALHWGDVPVLQTNFGLNPGWIQPVPQYQTTSPVQAQYAWGAHPFQAGPTFNAQLAAHGINAPVVPWGLQQAYQQLTPEETAALVHAPAYLQQLPGAPVAGPVVPR